VKVLVEGKQRAKITKYADNERYFLVEVRDRLAGRARGRPGARGADALGAATFETYVKLNKRMPPELVVSVQSIDNPSRLADTIAAHVNLKLSSSRSCSRPSPSAPAWRSSTS
jgi:ATP-dependent Lon protease